MVHCNQCGYDWEPMKGIPKACTKCKRYDWSEPKKGHGEGTSRVTGSCETVIEEDISGDVGKPSPNRSRSAYGGPRNPEPVIRAARGFESRTSPSKSVGVGTAAVAALEKSVPVKKGVRMIHLSEVASLSTEEIEAMQKPKGPSIMAEGFPISIPAMPKKKSGNGAFPHKLACPRCEKTESIRPWGSMHRCIECGVNF